jgi:hypothetical protein
MKRAERGTRRFAMRVPAIDVVKGLAIIGVIAQHALTRETMDDTGADFWLRQSVPVLFVLMGFNAARSSLRRPAPTLAEAYGARYWRGRYRRILLPLLIVSAVAARRRRGHRAPARRAARARRLPAGAGSGRLLDHDPAHVHADLARVDAPLPAPPGLVVLGAIALNVSFELWAGQHARLQGRRQPRRLPLRLRRVHPALLRRDRDRHVAGDRRRARGRRRLVVVALAVPSACTSRWPGPTRRRSRSSCTGSRSRPTSPPCLGGGDAAGGRCTSGPPTASRARAGSSGWGVASFEIFLVQVVWLGVLPERGQIPCLAALVAGAVFLGWALQPRADRAGGPLRDPRAAWPRPPRRTDT